jgi:hypothetical protein
MARRSRPILAAKPPPASHGFRFAFIFRHSRALPNWQRTAVTTTPTPSPESWVRSASRPYPSFFRKVLPHHGAKAPSETPTGGRCFALLAPCSLRPSGHLRCASSALPSASVVAADSRGKAAPASLCFRFAFIFCHSRALPNGRGLLSLQLLFLAPWREILLSVKTPTSSPESWVRSAIRPYPSFATGAPAPWRFEAACDSENRDPSYFNESTSAGVLHARK